MPKKISGAKRKELNESRAADAVAGRIEGVLFGRVIKLLGNGQVHVMIPTITHGPKTLLVRLPRLFSKRGSTPLSNNHVVSFFVGTEFDPEKDLTTGEAVVTKFLFDITSILDDKSVQTLVKEGTIPTWMMRSGATDTTKAKEEDGYVFTEDVEDEKEEKEKGVPGRKKADPLSSRLVHVSDELDIDTI